MAVKRLDEYTIAGSVPSGGVLFMEINPTNPATREYQQLPVSFLVPAGPVTGDGITMNTAALLGRTTAAAGAVEEITPGSSLVLGGGGLDTVQDIRTTAAPVFAGLTVGAISSVLKAAAGLFGAATPGTDFVAPGLATGSGLTMNTLRMLARLTAGAGAIEEIAFDTGTFTPAFTFATPGDLSVAYASQVGWYLRIGVVVLYGCIVSFTPTYTTSTGDATFTGFPLANRATNPLPLGAVWSSSTITWPAGTSVMNFLLNAGASAGVIRGIGSGIGPANWGTAQFPTATARVIRLWGSYLTDP